MVRQEARRIEAAGGFVNGVGRVNGNLNLTRSIGDLKYKQSTEASPADQMITAQPDVRRFELAADDEFMVLACDGIWDCMSSQECVDFDLQIGVAGHHQDPRTRHAPPATDTRLALMQIGAHGCPTTGRRHRTGRLALAVAPVDARARASRH